jgi:hypothetical protein
MGGKVILTHQTIVEAINAIDKKSGIQINNPPEIIQLTLF